MRIEKTSIPANIRSKVNTQFRNYQTDIDALTRKLTSLKSSSDPFGNRYTDEDDGEHDIHMEQRHQLLNGTDRLERSSRRLQDRQVLDT
jgi:vesicle transport through interaction with t-SNAREs protein 1